MQLNKKICGYNMPRNRFKIYGDVVVKLDVDWVPYIVEEDKELYRKQDN
jgi:hypothetical protein